MNIENKVNSTNMNMDNTIKPTNMWAFRTETREMSEVIQRLAFSFGYDWNQKTKEVRYTDVPYIIFDDAKQQLFWCTNDPSEVNRKYVTFNEISMALNRFKKPISVVHTVDNVEVFADGSVKILSRDPIISGETLRKVNSFLLTSTLEMLKKDYWKRNILKNDEFYYNSEMLKKFF